MPSNLTCLKVFFASPSGLTKERKAFRNVIDEYNKTEAIERGFYFQAVGWEDTLSAVGRPQATINKDIRECDYITVMFWDRWGTRPDKKKSKYTSATEEEYNVALRCHGSKRFPMKQIVMMFKAVYPRQMGDAGLQLRKVLRFKKKIEKENKQLYIPFGNIEEFKNLIRSHLGKWLRDEEQANAK